MTEPFVHYRVVELGRDDEVFEFPEPCAFWPVGAERLLFSWYRQGGKLARIPDQVVAHIIYQIVVGSGSKVTTDTFRHNFERAVALRANLLRARYRWQKAGETITGLNGRLGELPVIQFTA